MASGRGFGENTKLVRINCASENEVVYCILYLAFDETPVGPGEDLMDAVRLGKHGPKRQRKARRKQERPDLPIHNKYISQAETNVF